MRKIAALNPISFLGGILLIGLTEQPKTLAAQVDQAVDLTLRGLLRKE